LRVVEEIRGKVREITIDEARRRLAANPGAILLDVREDHEWQAGHAAEAKHLGRGILERDIERTYSDPSVEILMYCGGGYRSAMACEVAQRMGYRNVASIAGGWKAMAAAGWPKTP
jgi:rhodanese-related sulfurtransferase